MDWLAGQDWDGLGWLGWLGWLAGWLVGWWVGWLVGLGWLVGQLGRLGRASWGGGVLELSADAQRERVRTTAERSVGFVPCSCDCQDL
ncbi:hypothetical protein F8O06_10770 [Pseudoclavibacter sp. CFCC 14310]|nr:hypothetical protein F8O06_10770 [Pseudoclavibacter sp. CFCC 14310]